MDGRQILVEEVPVTAIRDGLSQLPLTAQAGGKAVEKFRRLASGKLDLPPRHVVRATDKRSLEIAAAAQPTEGLVLDYVQQLYANQTDYLFQGETTYHVVAPVNISGTATFEGGAVIKYSQIASLNVSYPGTVKMLSSAYRPVVFTSENDNSVGDAFGSGTPSSYDKALVFTGSGSGASSLSLSNFRILYANTAVSGSGISLSVTLTDGQMVNCATNFYTPGQTQVTVNNVLMAKFSTAFIGSYMNVHAQNCTFDGIFVYGPPVNNGSCLVQGNNPSVVFNAVNCVVANVTVFATSGVGISGDHNGFYRNGPSAPITFGTSVATTSNNPFQTVQTGGGNYYLNYSSAPTFQNAGTTSIDSALKIDLRRKTTQPPSFPSGNNLSDGQKFSQATARDSGTGFDLGFHYDPIDWAFANCSAQDATIFVAPGTVIATYGTSAASTAPALTLKDGSQLISVGTPTQAVWIVEYNTVHESPGTWQRTTGGSVVSTIPTHTPIPKINCRFTKWSMLANDDTNFVASAGTGPLGFRDCEFYGGKVGSTAPTLNFINCLFDRVQFVSTPTDAHTSSFQNNTFHGGSLTLNAPDWVINDNILDKTTLGITGMHSASHNAYVNVSPYGAVPNDDHPIQLTASPIYAIGPLGSYYLDGANTLLINPTRSTSRVAGDVGLYHYTVKANLDANSNQVKDGDVADTSLDIGYHYVALHYVAADSSYNPIDTDTDTVPDYLENYSGDGGTSNPLDIASWSSANVYLHVPSTLYPTIHAAYTAAAAGNIILVESDIYIGEDLYLTKSGTPTSPIAIRAVTIGGAIIDPQNQPMHGNVHDAINIGAGADYHLIQGFEIRNGMWGGIDVYSSHNQILNNEIHHNGSDQFNPDAGAGQSGIYSSPGTAGNWYIGNYVHDNGRMVQGQSCDNQTDPSLPNRHDHGLYLSGQNELVVNNLVASNACHGIQISGANSPAPSMQIYNNTIVLNRRGSGIILYDVMGGIDIANNIFYHNGNFANPPSCWRNYGIDTCNATIATGGNVQIRNNLFFGNRSGDWNLCQDLGNPNSCGSPCSIPTTPTCSVSTDPAFVNPYGDWHILNDSGAILKGANLYSTSPNAPGFATDQDYDGNPRPSDPNHDYDIGAYVHGTPFALAAPVADTEWNATSATEQLKANSLRACPAPATVLHTRYKLHADTCWISGADCACGGTIVLATSLTDGNQYDVQVAWGSGTAFLSYWSVTRTVTIGP